MCTFNADKTDHLTIPKRFPRRTDATYQSKVVRVPVGHLLDHIELLQSVSDGNVGRTVLKVVSDCGLVWTNNIGRPEEASTLSGPQTRDIDMTASWVAAIGERRLIEGNAVNFVAVAVPGDNRDVNMSIDQRMP